MNYEFNSEYDNAALIRDLFFPKKTIKQVIDGLERLNRFSEITTLTDVVTITDVITV